MTILVREPAVAGMFYPGDPVDLARLVDELLTEARVPLDSPVGRPLALIVPHAGYPYSGPIAASAYALLEPIAHEIERVVLLGPCHRVPVRGLAATSAEAFSTPLGKVPVDRVAMERALALPQVHLFDPTHKDEHSLEVHLPFLQTVLGEFELVPLVVGDASEEEVAEVLRTLWTGPDTLVVVSSDLSHYLDSQTARAMDEATSRGIEALDSGAVGPESACGRIPILGLLAEVRSRGLKITTVDLRNSGDTAGPTDQVVGYGAYVVHH